MGHHYKKIAILGLGVSGASVLKFLSRTDIAICAWDDRADIRAQFSDCSITPLNNEILRDCDALVAAAGISDNHEVIVRAKDCGLDVICDAELWSQIYPQARIIAVTGTNGKSTVTAMLCHVLTALGYGAQMGGNIGVPVFDLDMARADQIFVLELSSYQIERCKAFKAELGILMNITPDHLDRHGDMEHYARIKESLLKMSEQGVICTGDPYCKEIAVRLNATGQEILCVDPDGLDVGLINRSLVTKSLEVFCQAEPSEVFLSLQDFKNLPHRRQLVADKNNVQWINDSKATNIDATRGALDCYDSVLWIVGGTLKEGGLEGLEESAFGVVHAFVIGADTGPVVRWLAHQNIDYTLCGDMASAVSDAYHMTQGGKGKTVLLSPAAASFDQYSNFSERGEDFVSCVREVLS